MNCVFDVTYINWAWGFQHSGTIITHDGIIHKYDISSLNQPDASLNTKLRYSKPIGRVSPRDMDELCFLLRSIQGGKWVKSGEQGFDAGGQTYIGYLQGKDGLYDRINIWLWGDIGYYNTKPNSKHLEGILKSIIRKNAV